MAYTPPPITDKIGSSENLGIKTALVCLGLFILIEIVLNIFYASLITCGVGLAIFFIIYGKYFVEPTLIEVSKYQGVLVFDPIFRTSRGLFEGIHKLLFWEQIVKIHEKDYADLQAEIEDEISETFTTKSGGTVKGTSAIMIKLDCGELGDPEEERTEKLIRFASFTENAIKKQFKTRATQIKREIILTKTNIEAVSLKSDDVFPKPPKPRPFEELEADLAVKVIKNVLKDIDYTKKTQDYMNSLFAGDALSELTSNLVAGVLASDGVTIVKYTEPEAKALAPLMMEHVRLNKSIQDFNLSGVTVPPVIIKLLEGIAKKYFS